LAFLLSLATVLALAPLDTCTERAGKDSYIVQFHPEQAPDCSTIELVAGWLQKKYWWWPSVF